jgi:hypothetical protein
MTAPGASHAGRHRATPHTRLNVTVTVMRTATGRPSSRAGS